MRKRLQSGVAGVLVVLFCALVVPPGAVAEPVAVRFTEGVARGFPVLRSIGGEVLAHGDLVQLTAGDRVQSRDVFSLITYRIVQRGPSFPETIEASVDRVTGRYHVRYRADDDSPEEVHSGSTEIPADVANGLLGTLLKNLEPGASKMVSIVAFTPQPRMIRMLLEPMAAEPITMAGMPIPATRYQITPQLGLMASLLVTDLPDVKTWIATGDAPAFLRFEGPLYLMGPVWRIDWN
jgi:hypothetical protein